MRDVWRWLQKGDLGVYRFDLMSIPEHRALRLGSYWHETLDATRESFERYTDLDKLWGHDAKI